MRIRIAVSLVLIASFMALFPTPGGFAEFHTDPRRGGSLSAPTGDFPAGLIPEASSSTDDEKAERQARKAAREAEEDQEEASKETRKQARKAEQRHEESGAGAAPPAPEPATDPGQRRAVTATSTERSAAEQVILEVFGPEAGPTAIRVARCESSMAPGASNGSYAGLFQMGSYERSAYGHGSDPRSQAEAAYSYFSRAGWRPWSASRRCWA